MPIVRVQLLEGRTVDQKRALAAAITDAVVEHANVSAQQVRVVFEDHEPHNWAIAGQLVVDRRAAAAAALDEAQPTSRPDEPGPIPPPWPLGPLDGQERH